VPTAVRDAERRGHRRAVRSAPPTAVAPVTLTLLTVGLEPPPLFPRAHPVRVLPELSEGAACRQVLDLAASRTEKGGYLVVVYPDWLPPEEQARLATVRAALQSSRLVLVPTGLPSLAASVLVAVTAAAAALGMHHPGALVAALPALTKRLPAVAWRRNFTRLGRPKPPPLPSLPEPHGLVVAGSDGDRLERWVSIAAGRAPVTAVEAPRRSGAHWASGGVVEAVAYPLAVEDLAARLTRRLVLRRCGWCGEAIASRPCPFCRIGEVDR